MTSIRENRPLIRGLIAIGIVSLLVIFWFTGLLATVRPISRSTSLAAVMEGGHTFDKVQYVNGIWESRVLPTVEQKSVNIDMLVAALEKDPKQATKQYGNDVGGAYNFLVRLSGKVTNIDTKLETGTITVGVPFEGGTLPVKVQIGPIVLGTALRDAVGFISFEQFINQMQFGNVADELNTRVVQNVVSKLDLATLEGKQISIDGAFTYDGSNAKDILVTPVIVRMG